MISAVNHLGKSPLPKQTGEVLKNKLMKLNDIQRGFGFFLILVFLLPACDNRTANRLVFPFEMTGQTMGTGFSIKASVLPESVDADQLKDDINELLELINDQMSTYRPNSELSKFNSSELVEWQPVS